MTEIAKEQVEQGKQIMDVVMRWHVPQFDNTPRWTWIADDVGGEGG